MAKPPVVSRSDEALLREYAGSDLGHGHRNKRLIATVTSLAPHPQMSFPVAAGADVNRLYEFFSNPQVFQADILAGHIQQTILRCQQVGSVDVATDTTEFNFGPERRSDLGPVTGGHGFLAHVALAVTRDGRVLGVLGFTPWVRPLPVAGEKRDSHTRAKDPQRESVKWKQMVDGVEEVLRGSGVVATYLSDRESDDYPYLHSAVHLGRQTVVRVMHDRVVFSDESGTRGKLYKTMDAVEGVLLRDVPICERIAKKGRKKLPPKASKTHPPRRARSAALHFSAMRITIKRPDKAHHGLEDTITLNAVHVDEPNPPEGEEKVEWRLLTTMPVETPQDIAAVVDAYCRRWTIEEFFKCLKSGCNIEARQLEFADSLINMTAMFLPMAYQLLLLRDTARSNPDADACTVMSEVRLNVLRAVVRKPLSATPSVGEILLAIAALGGHLKRNGAPGWITLWRGMQTLCDYEAGWLAREAFQETRES